MSRFNGSHSIGEIVAMMPMAELIFKGYSIDFYFNGYMPLSEVLKERKLNEDEVLNKLNTLHESQEKDEQLDYSLMSSKELIDYLVNIQHEYVMTLLREISELSKRVIRANGPSHSNYFYVYKAVHDFKISFEKHFKNRELGLFTYIKEYEQNPSDELLKKIKLELKKLRLEYEEIDNLHKKLIDISRDHSVPQNELGAYCSMFKRLKALKANLLFQAHLINNVLIKRIRLCPSHIN